MTDYYRLTDARVLDLDPAFVAQLSPSKRDTLRLYFVDAQPVPTALQVVRIGPIQVGAIEARQTWLLVDKTPAQVQSEQFAAERAAELAQIRLAYNALKNGTGTAGERLTRCERVLARLLKDIFGGEPV